MQEDGPILVSPILEQLKKEAAQQQQQHLTPQSSPSPYSDDGLRRASVQDAQLVLEAVYSVATQIPRQNHSVVGMGTYTDARRGWSMLAKEYAEYNQNHEYCK
jgi:hypothetical protein|eukprot:scaffold1606_cov301-Chaetoceros_neogracile.AAC.11